MLLTYEQRRTAAVVDGLLGLTSMGSLLLDREMWEAEIERMIEGADTPAAREFLIAARTFIEKDRAEQGK